MNQKNKKMIKILKELKIIQKIKIILKMIKNKLKNIKKMKWNYQKTKKI